MRLKINASDGVLVDVLFQQGNNNLWYPVAFFSKTIALVELNYKVYNKEILAIICTLSHWRAKLQGAFYRLEIYTNY